MGAFARERRFWVAVGWAALFGVVLGAAGIVYLLVVEALPHAIWGDADGSGFADGQVWWIPLAGAFGLIVGLLRRWLGDRAEQPNLVEGISGAHVDTAKRPARSLCRWSL